MLRSAAPNCNLQPPNPVAPHSPLVGQVNPETLRTTRERHIRCNPTLAQFIVADEFPPVTVEGPFDKRQLDPAYVRQQERGT